MEAKLAANPRAKNGGTDVFEKGDYETDHITVKASEGENAKAWKGKRVKEASLPVDVFIVTPKEKGTYPVLLFCHGWTMKNDCYSDLFDHIASHGYIIVAPQFYHPVEVTFPIPEEIERAKAVLEWLPTGIAAALKEKDYDVYPDENNLVVTGHSRGGMVAFALALGETDEKIPSKKRKATPLTVRDPPPQKFKAVIGIDPVGGTSPYSQEDPKILQYIPRCFNMSIPVAVVGAGLSNQSKVWGFPACAPAPDGVNHSEFFNESKPPVCYFLATEYGHFDMVNDSDVGHMKTFVAKRGKEGTYDLMRSTTGGIVVAFLRAYLGDEDDDLKAIVDDPSIAPVLLDPVIHIADVK